MPTKRLKSKKTLKDKGFPVTFSSDKRRRDSQLINKRKLNMKQMIVKNNWSRLGHPSTLPLRSYTILEGQRAEVRIGGHGLCAEKHTGL